MDHSAVNDTYTGTQVNKIPYDSSKFANAEFEFRGADNETKFVVTRITQVNRMFRSRRVLAIGGKHCDYGWTGSVFIHFYFL